jgi:threonine/homoserine efflux transporter RhtA
VVIGSVFQVLLRLSNVVPIAEFALQIIRHRTLSALAFVQAMTIIEQSLAVAVASSVIPFKIMNAFHDLSTQITVELLAKVRKFVVGHRRPEPFEVVLVA